MPHAEYYKPGPHGWKKCKPGNKVRPAVCDYHTEHHWCDVCEGFYGVPHDGGMHDGPSAHPMRDPRKCVCRVCVGAATPMRHRLTERT